MYFFYFDESGSRDPSVGTAEKPKDHLYVLLTVGMYERKWRSFDQAITKIKLDLIRRLRRDGLGRFDLADCEIKSNWVRNNFERNKSSEFLHSLGRDSIREITNTYYEQITRCNMVIIAIVIDKRYLHDHVTHETLHKKAYEFALERIQMYMHTCHPKHLAMIVMDDTSKQLNRAVAMKHAFFLRVGNQNMEFPAIVEYPFFARSELSNGIQLADLVAYNIYRAFKTEDPTYSHFRTLLGNIYRGQDQILHGIKVWPENSPLVHLIPKKPESIRC